jgi:pSer/pThr/pTyr-binding forkhead associated (FHA) protein
MSDTGFLELKVPAEDNKIELSQANPLKWHARLEWLDGEILVTDLGGDEPIEIDGEQLRPLQPRILKADDIVSIAGMEISFSQGDRKKDGGQQSSDWKRHQVLIITPDWKREIELKSSSVKIGRAEENDIIINNSGVSRFHARLDKTQDRYVIVDQESTFGIRSSGQRVTRKELVDGDTLQIADDVALTYQVTALPGVAHPSALQASGDSSTVGDGQSPADKVQPLPFIGQTSFVDMDRLLEADESVPRASGLSETMDPHLVVQLGDETWQELFTKDQMAVGRGDDNDIVIPDTSVSGSHATLERTGDSYVIRDSGSDNGIWIRKERVDSHVLRPGDVINIGRAKLVFKGGFNRDDLTLIRSPMDGGMRPRRPVVFVPGLGGSELWLGSEKIYPSPKVLISNPEILSLPGDPRIEARKIVSDIVIVPGIIKQEQYSRLGDYLENRLGYTRGKDLIEFAYDWRQDIRSSARKLAEAIEEWNPGAPITVIGHSLGTLVTRYFVEKFGGKRSVERIVLLGGPQYGTPKALAVMLTGPGILPFGISNEKIRDVMAYFPSSYQILPVYPSVFDQTGQQINVMEDNSWLPEDQHPYLKMAQDFRKELGAKSSVPAVSIFGYGYKTAVRANIVRRKNRSWKSVTFDEKNAGDLSVPAGSAVLKDSEIHPVFQEHGALYVDNDVKMRLKVELTRSTTLEGKRDRSLR